MFLLHKLCNKISEYHLTWIISFKFPPYWYKLVNDCCMWLFRKYLWLKVMKIMFTSQL